MKLFILFFQLFKINKNIQDTLSLCVTRNGTAHSSQYFANSFKICFADRNLLTLESLSHGLCSKCTDLIEKSCTCLLRTGGSPMSFMSFVNFSQFNLDFHEFRNYLIYFDRRFFSARYATAESAATLPSPADLIYWYGAPTASPQAKQPARFVRI